MLSGSNLMLLDPSGKNLPEDWGRNTCVLPITNVRRYVILDLIY